MNRNTEIVLISKDELEMMIIDAVKAVLKHHMPVMPSSLPSVMKIDEVCEYTGLKRDTIYQMTRKREIPHSKLGKRLYFDRAKIDEWLLANDGYDYFPDLVENLLQTQ